MTDRALLLEIRNAQESQARDLEEIKRRLGILGSARAVREEIERERAERAERSRRCLPQAKRLLESMR